MTDRLRGAGGMIRAVLAVMFLTGGAAAHDIDTPRMQLLIALIAQNGCAMTDRVADAELPQYGFTRHETRQIVADLMQDGRAQIEPSTATVRLNPEECF
ncbi:MAG: hypothetical protein QNJ16_10600 [Rhodobacter sp.]|nr:hypothetical protein [Rhodobacter sp.]